MIVWKGYEIEKFLNKIQKKKKINENYVNYNNINKIINKIFFLSTSNNQDNQIYNIKNLIEK